MSRMIDADALEREGWKLHRNYQQDENVMVYEEKALSEIQTVQPDVSYINDGDTVYRQAAIDEAEEWIERYYCRRGGQRERDAIKNVIGGIKKLPSAQSEKRTEERTETHACDCIERQAVIDAMCELMHHWFGSDTKDEIREIKRELEKLPSAEPNSDRYEQGVIEGRVQMRTELLTKLKEMVGEEIWTNI